MLNVVSKKAFLDANVLFPYHLRELLLALAQAQVISLAWSDKVIHEWQYHAGKLGRSNKASQNATTIDLNERFPDALVNGYENLIGDLTLPDPDDLHVLAAAIKGECDFILTFNIADFRKKVLRPFGLVPIRPQDYLINILEKAPNKFLHALHCDGKYDEIMHMFKMRNMDILHTRINKIISKQVID